MKPLFKTEQDAIEWIEKNTSLLIVASKRSKNGLQNPFISKYAFGEVTYYLGKELFKLINSHDTLKD